MQILKQHQPENGEQNHQILIKIIEYIHVNIYVNISYRINIHQYSSIFSNIQYPTYFNVFNTFFEPRISMFFFQIWPGSPLADCVFHILMADILHHLQTWIDNQDEYQSILQQLDVHGGFVAWADDLAIPWATRTAAEMPAALRKILHMVASLFLSKGFILNLDKGKTSAVVTFRGPQAPQLRQAFQLGPKPGDVMDFEGRQIFLHYVPTLQAFGHHLRF